jgi:hypothetical protein
VLLRAGFARTIFIAGGVLLSAASAAHAEQWHQFDIKNNTSRTLTIKSTITRCVTEADWPQTIGPGQTYTVKWHDTNNYLGVGDTGWTCTNRDKFVAFVPYLDGANEQYTGYLGITHRELSGSDWYNGQFYAASINVSDTNQVSGSDGDAPPGNIVALCSHGNNCFGPWSEMEMNNKDSYNWQRSYKTEDGWAFQINE